MGHGWLDKGPSEHGLEHCEDCLTITSLIINTAALAKHADVTLSSGRSPYSWRTYALRNWLLPAYTSDALIDEVIVVGEWEEGDGYTYVPLKNVHRSWQDCIAQRQAGFEVSTGEIIIHQHDDHLLDTFNSVLDEPTAYPKEATFQVLVPQRWTRLRNPHGERLNHGENQYIGGHCTIYRREVLEQCPWKNVPGVFTLDVEHTKQIRAAGFSIAWSDSLRCWDTENGAEPWK